MIKNSIIFILISLSSSYDIGLHTVKYTPIKNIDMNMGDWREGKRIFEKYLKLQCGLSNDKFTIIYTQDEWEDIAQAGKFKEEILKICPKLKEIYRDEWSPHLYQFAYEFASDSGNVPFFEKGTCPLSKIKSSNNLCYSNLGHGKIINGVKNPIFYDFPLKKIL